MERITAIEKGTFLKLLNRNGYVLDLSTNDFDTFTMESIGTPLCEHYSLSKGKSLMTYINEETDESKVEKIITDLFKYYEATYQHEYDDESCPDYKKFAPLYQRCKTVIDRLKQNPNSFIPLAEDLKEKFSSEYISKQLNIMIGEQKNNPTEAIGKAKELIESCCKTILENRSIEVDKNWDIVKLVGETTKLLKVTPNDMPETAPEIVSIKAILGNLKAIASNVANLRNSYGSGHGKSASYVGLEERHAKLAIGSSITLVHFLWDSHERQPL